MIKLILCGVVVLFSALAGWSKASVYSERVTLLTDLTTNLKYLESEMGYRMEPVPVILKRIGETRTNRGGAFFSETARLLESREAGSLREAWSAGMEHAFGTDVLTSEDRTIIEELGYELGGTDMASQRAMFAHCFTGLEQQTSAAKEDARVRGKMYRGLGISAGILTAVLFL